MLPELTLPSLKAAAKDLGDFQTPPALVMLILDCLQEMGWKWSRVLEPTCGRGNFIDGLLSLEFPPTEIQGIELQEEYVRYVRERVHNDGAKRVTIHQGNIFKLHLAHDLRWQEKGPLLVLGNPPWVTNAELGILKSNNMPNKTNLKNLVGLDAVTGSANFDITESIWMKLIRELASERPTIALLCKTAVARNVLQFSATVGLPISNAIIRKIDAKKWFGASVDACLFCVDVLPNDGHYNALTFPDLQCKTPASIINVTNGKLVLNSKTRIDLDTLDGKSPLVWRQGLKHDAASVVELQVDALGNLCNKNGEVVTVEADYVYPLLKSSDLGGKGKVKPPRSVIVPQKRVGDNTLHLKHAAPDLWRYLSAHQRNFEQRKSSIYQKQPPFAYLGLGPYSFTPFKVAISGMYKTPIFRAIGLIHGRPVMFDDTCYFLPCVSSMQASLIAGLLNQPLCLDFLHSITFWDAKRPVTKKVLQGEYERLAQGQAQPAPIWPASLEELLLTGSSQPGSLVQRSLL